MKKGVRLGFTGTRDGMTLEQKATFRKIVHRQTLGEVIQFDHGMCVGADEEAHEIVHGVRRLIYCSIIGHPCNIDRQRSKQGWYAVVKEVKPPLVRNKDIVDDTDVLIATPKEAEEVLRSGTWSTVRYAVKQGKPVYVIRPDGTLHPDFAQCRV